MRAMVFTMRRVAELRLLLSFAEVGTLVMAMTAMADPTAIAAEVTKRLHLTTTTLYTYVNGDGTPKAAGQLVLESTPK